MTDKTDTPPKQKYDHFHRISHLPLVELGRPGGFNKTSDSLIRKTLVMDLVHKLESEGFRRVGNFCKGSFAIVLEANNHQVIRIVDKTFESPRLNKPYILQPLATIDDFDGYRIEILPKVRTLEELSSNMALAREYGYEGSASEIFAKMIHQCHLLKKKVSADGCLPVDINFENVGLIKNGNGFALVCADAGAVEQRKTASIISKLIKRKPEPLSQVQEEYAQSLGLTHGKITGVVSDAHMDSLKERQYAYGFAAPDYRAEDSVAARIVREKLYVDETLRIIGDAIKTVGKDKANAAIAEKGLCGFAKDVLDERAKAGSKKSVV